MNHLITIGYIGIMRAYLNVPRDEAIRRFIESEESDIETAENTIHEFDFNDEFKVYSASSIRTLGIK